MDKSNDDKDKGVVVKQPQPRTHSKTSSIVRIAAAVAAAKEKRPTGRRGKRKSASSDSEPLASASGVVAKRKKIGPGSSELAESGDVDASNSVPHDGTTRGRYTQGGGLAAASPPQCESDNDAFQTLWLRQTCFENEMRQRHVALQSSISELRNYCGRQFEMIHSALRSMGGIVDEFGPSAAGGREYGNGNQAPAAKDGDEVGSKGVGDGGNAVLNGTLLPEDHGIGPQIEVPPSAIKTEWDGEKLINDTQEPNQQECTPVVVVVSKPEPDSRLGIGLIDFDQEGTSTKQIKVSAIVSDGLFGQTALTVGMTISTINGTECATAEEAASLLKEAQGQITVVAWRDEVGKPARLSHKPRTLGVLWNEYKFGLNGNKPAGAFTLEERTQSSTLKQTYYRRNVIWKCIERLVAAGLTAEAAIGRIHAVYGHDASPSDISRRMVADKAKYKDDGGMHPDLQSAEAERVPEGGGVPPPAALSRRPNTLELLWAEYKVGLDGNKPAERFTQEERNATSKTKQTYYRRNVLWQCMEQLVIGGRSPGAAIALIRDVYGEDTAPSDLIKRMVDDKKIYTSGVHPDLSAAMASGRQSL